MPPMTSTAQRAHSQRLPAIQPTTMAANNQLHAASDNQKEDEKPTNHDGVDDPWTPASSIAAMMIIAHNISRIQATTEKPDGDNLV